MMLYKLKLAVCFAIPEGFGTCIISLVDESEKRALSITTTEYVAEQLKACNLKTSDFKNYIFDNYEIELECNDVEKFSQILKNKSIGKKKKKSTKKALK